MCACVCVSAHMRHGFEHPGISLCVFLFLDIFMTLNWSYFLFGLSVMFLVNSIPVKISKLNKRERERERERERQTERERGRWRETVR